MNDFIYTLLNMPAIVYRGIIVGLLVSVCASLLGVTLVLKRFSMIGDGLSHVAFGAMSIALVLNLAPLAFSVPVVIVCAFLLLQLTRKSSIAGDGATALISSTALAVGIVAVSLAGGVNTNVSDYMFGSIVAISKADLALCVPVLVIILVLLILCYNKIFAVTFDEGFSKVSGVRVELYNTVIALLTALVIVIGMRIMGTLLISGLIIFPALCAMRVFASFRNVIICSAIISCVCFLSGVAASILLDTPVGASIVIMNAGAFCIFSLVGALKKK